MPPVLASLRVLRLVWHVRSVALQGGDNSACAVVAPLSHLYSNEVLSPLTHISAVDATHMRSLFEFLSESRVVVEKLLAVVVLRRLKYLLQKLSCYVLVIRVVIQSGVSLIILVFAGATR